jgi:hypothetical protein
MPLVQYDSTDREETSCRFLIQEPYNHACFYGQYLMDKLQGMTQIRSSAPQKMAILLPLRPKLITDRYN